MKCIADGCLAEAEHGNYCSIHRKKGSTKRPGLTGYIVSAGYAKKPAAKKVAVKKPAAKKVAAKKPAAKKAAAKKPAAKKVAAKK